MKSFITREDIRLIILVLVLSLIINVLNGQDRKTYFIKGNLTDQHMNPLPYATVALRRTADSTLMTGTLSSETGEFIFNSVSVGMYRIEISAIGYESQKISIKLNADLDAGNIIINEQSVSLSEVVVEGERIKTKTEADRTTYYINKKMYEVSENGAGLLNYIPGVQVDLMKNISLAGSRNTLILVDGKERDKNFLAQLSSDKIDRIEIINSPDPKYDADITGVIDVILKKDSETGLEGNIHAEIPLSRSETYIFPSYSFTYNYKRLCLFTSYNGDMSYFRNIQNSIRNYSVPTGEVSISSEQVLKQKDWSHRFHYGIDYEINARNKVSFYGFINPYSNELDGNVSMKTTKTESGDQLWYASKEDDDTNHADFYSVSYSHAFDKQDNKITFDMSYFNFNGTNSTTYTANESSDPVFPRVVVNQMLPSQKTLNFKTDFTSNISERLKIDAGVKIKTQVMRDKSSEFKNSEQIYAIYGRASVNRSAWSFVAGLRVEDSRSLLSDGTSVNVPSVLPNAILTFRLPAKQSIKLSYSRSVNRPGIYQLNPFISADDPYSVQAGNPALKPEYFQSLSATYTVNINNNFLSAQLYHNKRSDAISHYTFVNDTSVVETRFANLGRINAYGIELSGALKVGKAVSLNPYARLSYLYSTGNSITAQYNIGNLHKIVFETSFSAIISFKHEFSASCQLQYSSPQIDIQGITFSDALYFVSLEKTFIQKIKVGISSALPLMRKFTYDGSEAKTQNLYSYYEGNIKLSAVPVWLKINYQFKTGKKNSRQETSHDAEEIQRKKGF
jgi:outer membrane receptor protein involved in Fe transport